MPAVRSEGPKLRIDSIVNPAVIRESLRPEAISNRRMPGSTLETTTHLLYIIIP